MELAVDLLYAKVNPFLEDTMLTSKRDFQLFAEIYKFFMSGTNLVDRAGIVSLPIKFNVADTCTLPLLEDALPYKQCCIESAQQIYNTSKIQQKNICVMYSGGIDSTLALLSIAHTVPEKDHRDIVVALSNESIIEYSKLYDRIIRKFTVVGSYAFSKYINDRHLVVTGEFNDQLFGSTSLSKWIAKVGWSSVQQPATLANIQQVMHHYGINETGAQLWYDLVQYHQKQLGYCKIHTIGDFFWYIDFMFKWQNVNYRMPVLFTTPQDGQLRNPFFHFYSTHAFQRWAMDRKFEKMQVDDFAHVKMIAKHTILDYTRDESYFNTKHKLMSLTNLLRGRTMADVALTSKYKVLLDIPTPSEYYVPDTLFQNA